ncbi:MAG: Ppx/GppA phosphatase family protein [Campylobacterota bacterium]|nr:Ppx/GppA phosphatase family protein [Campylobacterota bacterium]
MARRTAVIDIGSNSVRLVIYEKTSRYAFHLLHEEKSRVRISENAYENDSNLQEAAMTRAIAALREFLSITTSYKVRKTLCVATSAVRDAKNKKEFLHRVKHELGLNIKVIDGSREAYYGGIACANLLPKTSGVVIDIGGGSTECACILNGKVVDSYSLNLGTVRLKELFFDKGDIKGAKKFIDEALLKLPTKQAKRIIGIGGTFRALSKAVMQKNSYPLEKIHAYAFSADELKNHGKKVLKVKDNTQLKELYIKPERFDVIRPGTLILLRLMKYLKSETMITSGAGVREGVYLCDILRSNRNYFPENYNPSLSYLQDTYAVDKRLSSLMVKVVSSLFDTLNPILNINPSYKPALLKATKLAIIGSSIHFYSYHKHSYLLIQSALEYGFSHEETILIATLTRYQNRKVPSIAHIEKYRSLLPDTQTLNNLTFLLSLCNVLVVHRPKTMDFTLELNENVLHVKSTNAPLHIAAERVASIATPENISIQFH